MKTLWERLSKENQSILINIQKEYPVLYEKTIEDLKNKTCWTNLTVSFAHLLIQDLTDYNKDFISLLDELFKN